MDREVDDALASIAAERRAVEKELEALSNELKAAYAKACMDEYPDSQSVAVSDTGAPVADANINATEHTDGGVIGDSGTFSGIQREPEGQRNDR